MEAAALVMFLGALVGSLHATPLPSESLLPTQENFDLDRFMGKWHGVCKQSSDEYKLTQTPGRFQYYFSPCDDLYVVDTDCDEYALVVEHKHKRNSDKRLLFVSLYGRTPVLPEALMETFRRVVTEQGMTEDNIGIQKNKGTVVLACFLQKASL